MNAEATHAWERIKKSLPGWQVLLRTDPEKGYFAHIMSPDFYVNRDDKAPHYFAYSQSADLALQLALDQHAEVVS